MMRIHIEERCTKTNFNLLSAYISTDLKISNESLIQAVRDSLRLLSMVSARASTSLTYFVERFLWDDTSKFIRLCIIESVTLSKYSVSGECTSTVTWIVIRLILKVPMYQCAILPFKDGAENILKDRFIFI